MIHLGVSATHSVGDGSGNPIRKPAWDLFVKPCKWWDQTYQPQLVTAGFLKAISSMSWFLQGMKGDDFMKIFFLKVNLPLQLGIPGSGWQKEMTVRQFDLTKLVNKEAKRKNKPSLTDITTWRCSFSVGIDFFLFEPRNWWTMLELVTFATISHFFIHQVT